VLASQAHLLGTVIDLINASISANQVPGVQITQVNMRLPDGRPVVLTWIPDAVTVPDPETGEPVTRGDWAVTAS
jgi:hypothetical protein